MDTVRLSVWLLVLMMVFVPLEKLFAVSPRKTIRKGLPADLGYYFLNNLVPNTVLVLPMAVIAWALHRLTPAAVHLRAGSLPTWARLLAAFIVGELGFYWGHRWAHEVPLLWRFHSIHHSPEDIHWLVNTHAHPLDIVFVRLCGLVPMYALGLARPLAGKRIDLVPVLILLVATAWGFFIHANVAWRFGWLEWLISTPHFHHWHHTSDEHVNRNYASMLPFLDKLFGTIYLPAKKWPPQYGVQQPMPSTMIGQLIQPFVPAQRRAIASARMESAGSAQSGSTS